MNRDRLRLWWLLCLVGLGCAGAPPTGVDLKSQAVSANDAGYQYYRQSRWNLAQEKFQQALRYNRLIDRREGIAANLNNLGVVAQEQGDATAAVEYFLEAQSVYRESGNLSGISETLNNLGLAYLSQGRVNQAQQAYQEALEAAQSSPPGPLLALSLSHLGDVARVRQDYPLALQHYHQALLVDEAQKDLRGRAMRWERLGRTFLDLKDYDRAAGYLQDALEEFRRLQYTDGIAEALRDLTLVALGRGDRQAAMVHGRLALELYQARGQEQEARELEKLLQRQGLRP